MLKHVDKIFVNGTISSCISIVIGGLLLLVVNQIVNSLLKRKYGSVNPTQRKVKKAILWALFFAIVSSEVVFLKSFTRTLLASGGIVAVVIGLASQEAASNIINGAMIFVYKPYQIGDFIVLSGNQVRGTVIDITLRHTVIETIEKTQMIIPNDIMNKNIIENISQIENVKANYLYVDIAYESDVDLAIQIIQDVVSKQDLFVDGRKSEDEILVPVIVYDLKDSGVQLRATVTSSDNATGFQLLSDCRKAILKEFKEKGVDIPYPHMHIVK